MNKKLQDFLLSKIPKQIQNISQPLKFKGHLNDIIKYTYLAQKTQQTHRNRRFQCNLEFKGKQYFFKFISDKISENEINSKTLEFEKKLIEYKDPQFLLNLIEDIIKLKQKYHNLEQYPNYIGDLLQKVSLLIELKRHEESEQLLQHILEQDEGDSDDALFHKVDAIMIQTISLENQNQQQQNIELLKQAQKLLEKSEIGLKSEHMAVCCSTLADNHYKLGNIQEAALCLEQSCIIYDYLLEQEHDEEQQIHILQRQSFALEQLGNFHADLRNKSMALKFLNCAIHNWDIIDKDNQIKSPYHIRIINSLGLCYSTFGEYEKGFNLQMKAKQLMEPVQPHLIEQYIIIVLGIARTYHNLMQYNQSREFTTIAEASARKHAVHPNCLVQVLEHKTNVLATFNEIDYSLKTAEEALEIMEKNNMKREPLYSRLLFTKGMILTSIQKFEEALIVAKIGYDISCDVFGPEDEQSADSLRLMGDCHVNIGINSSNKNFIETGLKQLIEAGNIMETKEARLQDYEQIMFLISDLYRKLKKYKESIIYAEKWRVVRKRVFEVISVIPEQLNEEMDKIDKYIEDLYSERNKANQNE